VSETTVKMRPVVDWSAALWAGVVSGIVFLLANLLLTGLTLGSPWIVLRVLASIVLGSGVLPPPATFNLGIAVVALLVNTVLSILFAGIIALIIHRWGLIVGLLGGAILGLALYAINFYTFSLLFPWFFPFRSWMMVVSHLIFGAVAGGTYELLEVEEFVPVEAES
jgi:hypothetical protein